MKKTMTKHKLGLFLVLSLCLSWIVWVPMALNKCGIIQFEMPLVTGSTIGAFGPLISLIILEKLTKRDVDVDEIYSQIAVKRNISVWLVPSALAFPSITILGNLIGGPTNYSVFLPQIHIYGFVIHSEEIGIGLVMLISILFFASLFTSPLLEEPSWRGFALEELQKRLGRNVGSFVLGSYWWLWHVPINIASGISHSTLTLVGYTLWVSQSFFIDSIYNLSERNLLAAMFCHSSMYITYSFLDGNYTLLVIPLMIIGVTVLRLLESKKTPNVRKQPIPQYIIFERKRPKT